MYTQNTLDSLFLLFNEILYRHVVLMRQYAYMYQITDEDGDDVALFKQYRRVNEPSVW